MSRLLARVAAAVLVGFALIAGGCYLIGFRLAAVTSGSMAPAIATGDAVVIRTGATPGMGDVVTFRVGAGGLVSHRVVGVTTVGGERAYTTRGDANRGADPAPVRASQLYGTVVARVPAAGRVAAFASGSTGRWVAGAVLVALLLPELLTLASAPRGRHFRGSPARRTVGAVK